MGMLKDAYTDTTPLTPTWGDPVHTPHDPMHAIVLTLEFGPGEADCLLVVGFVNPHDGNVSVVINHIDGLLTYDNAEEMFPQ
jgi:hypothetical protein